MAYAAAADLVTRFDVEVVGALAQDQDGVKASRDELLNSTIISAMLDDASGAVDVALLRGGRYDSSDLSGLSGNNLAHLKRITCVIAMTYLFRRRPGLYVELAEKFQEEADSYLKQLSEGLNMFDLSEQQAVVYPKYAGPELVRQSRMNQLLPDRAARGAYPVARPYRWPINNQ